MPRVTDDIKKATDKVMFCCNGNGCAGTAVKICRMDGMLYIMLVLVVALKCCSGWLRT